MSHPHPSVSAFAQIGRRGVEHQDHLVARGGHEALETTEQLTYGAGAVPPPPRGAGADHVHGVYDETGHCAPLYSRAMAMTTSGTISGLTDEDITTTLIRPDSTIRLQNADGGDTGDDAGDESDATDQGDPSDSNDATDQGDPSDEGDSADQ